MTVYRSIHQRYSQETAQIIGKEFERINEKHGHIDAETVKECARGEKSPLHSFIFDKNVGDAAEAYYTQRSHQLILEIYREEESETGEKILIPAFVNVEYDKGYEDVTKVLADKIRAETLLDKALREAASYQRKYQHLKAVREIIKAIERTMKRNGLPKKQADTRPGLTT